MNGSAGFKKSENVSYAAGNATLAWTPVSLDWTQGSQFAANASASLDPNLTSESAGLSLSGNLSNRILDGDFSGPGPWNYTNGKEDNTTAGWIPDLAAARLNHTSGPTQRMWDSLANIATNWTASASVGSESRVFQAPAAMGDFVNVSAGVAQFAGAQRVGAVDWSSVNRMSVSIYLNASAPAAFNVSALDSTFRAQTTTAIDLHSDWNTVTVNLSELGNNRSSLTALTLRVVGRQGQRLPSLLVEFEAIEVGNAKLADTTASVAQTFTKANASGSAPGSTSLAFDWSVANATGFASYRLGVVLTGPSGTFNQSLTSSTPWQWNHASMDTSPVTTLAGAYTLSFQLRVVLDNTTASNVTAFVDNTQFLFPDRHNATYLSQPLGFGTDSRYLSLAWSASLPTPETSVRLRFRYGNGTSDLGPWRAFAAPGTYGLAGGGVYFQLEADLNTTNASVTPTLASVSVAGEHRIAQAVIESYVFSPLPDFLHWRSFNASMTRGNLTAILFQVGDGSSWTQVVPPADISFLGGLRIAWRAVLSSMDGLSTPSLAQVDIVYDFLGSPVSISITPGGPQNVTQGESVIFTARVFDAGGHNVPTASIVWSTTDPAGHVYNNGTYVAGSVGTYYVNATVSGLTSVTQSVVVHVAPGVLPDSGLLGWGIWPFLLLVVAAAGLGFALYEFMVVRMFAIDDVLLIAKDGRLMMHNTRRMRADRDEDILSGMLTAIMAFLRDQDPEENGELKRFEVGGKTTLLERGKHVYLTVIYSGKVPRWAGKDLHRFMGDLEGRFGDAFANWTGSPEDLHAVKDFMQRFVSRVRYRRASPFRGRET